MSKLNIDQKSVRALFSEKKSDFLIPDYQRPYAWGEKECQTLWDDLFLFSFPDNDCDKFNSESDEYFLGPIVTFKNDVRLKTHAFAISVTDATQLLASVKTDKVGIAKFHEADAVTLAVLGGIRDGKVDIFGAYKIFFFRIFAIL